jgi:hypothetical protein
MHVNELQFFYPQWAALFLTEEKTYFNVQTSDCDHESRPKTKETADSAPAYIASEHISLTRPGPDRADGFRVIFFPGSITWLNLAKSRDIDVIEAAIKALTFRTALKKSELQTY